MPPTLETKLNTLPGVGPARAKALDKLGLHTAADLLAYLPREYEDRSLRESIAAVGEDETAAVRAMVTERFHTSFVRRGMELTKGKLFDHSGQIQVTFFNQSYVAKQLEEGKEYVFYGKLEGAGSRRRMANPYFEPAEAGKLVGGIVPVYPLTAGISQNLLTGLVRRVLPCAADWPESLPTEILTRYELAQAEFSRQNIHFPDSWEALTLARERLMFEELYCLSLGLALLRGRSREGRAIPFPQSELEGFVRRLPFALTGAQQRAMEELRQDLGQSIPMNRLLQGDVGSGKTVVAAAGAYLAWQNGCQSALMAPTELLARQHHRTLSQLLEGMGLRVGLLTGGMPAAQRRNIRESVALGEYDLLVGTHAILSDDVAFFKLGLVITDEQHRFGVQQRATLTAKGSQGDTSPHVLVMSATPIPRTLALMIYGDLDLSVLDELPPGRTPVATYVVGEDKRQRIYAFMEKHVAAGQQVYVVCPTVEEGGALELKAAEQYGEELKTQVFPHRRVAVIHGRMKPREKDKVMTAFAGGEIDILVSTTVIEVGVDVPNASLMVVENAERFGLSQLHQLRGRVGRGSHASSCVLITQSRADTALARLRALAATNDGFQLAEEDLRLRGPGDFFGARQHGLPPLEIASLAGDMRLLKQAQQAAAGTLQDDPRLEQPKHAPLRQKVHRLFEENDGARSGLN